MALRAQLALNTLALCCMVQRSWYLFASCLLARILHCSVLATASSRALACSVNAAKFRCRRSFTPCERACLWAASSHCTHNNSCRTRSQWAAKAREGPPTCLTGKKSQIVKLLCNGRQSGAKGFKQQTCSGSARDTMDSIASTCPHS